MDNQQVNEVESSSQENKLITLVQQKMMLYMGNDSLNRWRYAAFIYRVPEKLFKGNEDAYTPRIVSIGPFHHVKPHLQAMEHFKWGCLYHFLSRDGISTGPAQFGKVLVDIARLAEDMESEVRESYIDTFDHLSSVEFSKMIMLDAVFIVELLLENFREVEQDEDEHGLIYDLRFMKHDILHDMLLLENQLPLFVLKKLLSLVSNDHSIIDLAENYFKLVEYKLTLQTDGESRCLLDILRDSHLAEGSGRFLGSYRYRGKLVHSRSATELQEAAGVKFSVDRGGCLVHVVFDSGKGILHIPQVTVNEWTEAYFGNMMALEQCTWGSLKVITSYIILMNSLIKTSADVDLLVHCGIIENSLGENHLVADIFNNLYKEKVMENCPQFYYTQLCEDLNEYSRDYWHQWKAKMFKWKRMLRQDYFSNPWSTVSVIAAVILPLLTVIQTACSIIQI